MASITAGNKRCARCSMVVFDVFPKILQELMQDSGVPAPTLHEKIMKNDVFRKKFLNRDEIHKIQTLLNKGYSQLDVTLIYKIVKYFNKYIPSPTRKWGANPLPDELEIGDDVERIRLARNALVHKIKADVTEEEMNKFFDTFVKVGKRVDFYLNNDSNEGFEKMIENFKLLPFDDDKAKSSLHDLKAIECLKEVSSTEAGEKVVHIFYGKTVEGLIQKVRNEEATASNPVKFIIEGIDDDSELQTAILNSLEDQLHTKYIQFKNATHECIVLHVLIQNRVLQDKTLLTKEVESFIKYIFGMVNFEPKQGEDITVVMTSDEHNTESSVALTCPPEPVRKDIWSSSNSLVLNVEIKNRVLHSTDTLNESIGQFFGNIMKITNGSGFIKQKEFSVILEPHDVVTDFSQCQNEDRTEILKSYKFHQQSGDKNLEGTEISQTENNYLSNQSSSFTDTTTKETETEGSLEETECKDSKYATAQCPITPKPQRPWQHFFGFRKLIDLKEKDADEIVSTFYKHKMHLTEAMNDKNMFKNREIIMMLLQCFAKSCLCQSFSRKVETIFDILDNSIFLTESVVRFIGDAVSVTKLQKENYYGQSTKDLLNILFKLQSLDKVKSIPYITSLICNRLHTLEDIVDESMLQQLEGLKLFSRQLPVTTELKQQSMEEDKWHFYERSTSENFSKQGSPAMIDRRSKSDSGLELKEKSSWRLRLGFKRLVQLKDEDASQIISTFSGQLSVLKNALDDDEVIHNKDMVSLFLRCFAKCCSYESRRHENVDILEVLKDSVFLKDHVQSFVKNMALVQYEQKIIPPEKTIEDILTIFDSFNCLIPSAVPFIHGLLINMDTAMNAIKTQTNWMDENLWRKYHTLMDRQTATSPLKRK